MLVKMLGRLNPTSRSAMPFETIFHLETTEVTATEAMLLWGRLGACH